MLKTEPATLRHAVTQKRRKAARVMSGWKPNAKPASISPDPFRKPCVASSGESTYAKMNGKPMAIRADW